MDPATITRIGTPALMRLRTFARELGCHVDTAQGVLEDWREPVEIFRIGASQTRYVRTVDALSVLAYYRGRSAARNPT